MQQSDTTGKQIGAGRQGGKIKNVEILRFFFAWAIVGSHIVNNRALVKFGFSFLKPYWTTSGGITAGCFFVLAFYFLTRGRSIRLPMITFVCHKWLRLAPLVVVISAIGYILHCCGYWRWDWAANIEQWLLIHDWTALSPWGQFAYTAWWCSAYMFVAVVYLALVRTLPGRYVPLVLGILTIFGWRLRVCGPAHSKFGDILALGNTSATFFYLGVGALIAHIVRCAEERPTFKPSSRLVTWGYTLAEAVVIGTLFVRLFAAHIIVWFNPLLVTLWFSVLFVLFVLKRGYISRLFENNFSSFLGRYAYGIFVVHPLVLTGAYAIILPHFRAESIAHPWVVLGCIAGVTMLLAMAGYHFVERPIMRFCKRRLTGQSSRSHMSREIS